MSYEGRYRRRLSTLAANWRALTLHGLVALLFGLVVLFWPGLVLTVLAVLFGIYAIIDGQSRSYPPSDPRAGARRGHVRWSKARWVSSSGW